MREVHHFNPPLLHWVQGCSRIYEMLDRTWKRVGHGREGWEKGNKRRGGKSINLLVRLVTELLTKYCMVAYECNV